MSCVVPLRQTKIVATLGPATNSREALERLIAAGVDMVRMNFSHGEPEEHIERARLVRDIAASQGRNVAILGDLQGPKIRIARFEQGEVNLVAGKEFTLDADLASDVGTVQAVGLTYGDLACDCKPGDTLLLDDGRLSLSVLSIEGVRIHCRVLTGGILSNNKGINLLGGGLSAPTLTDKDKADIQVAASMDLDYLAVSFVRCREDVEQARRLLKEAGGQAAILSKIERAEVVENPLRLQEVIEASDAIMVARGDLGVEIGDAELVGAQKDMVNMARRLKRPVITATQMMESMVENSLPTRAEVFDVANAVLDGTDAVMLSAETAMGHCPHGVVEAMARIAKGAEHESCAILPRDAEDAIPLDQSDEAIAVAAMYATRHCTDLKAVICLSKSGRTALWMSRTNLSMPIFVLTRDQQAARRMALYKGVHCLAFDVDSSSPDVETKALDAVLAAGALNPGDKVLLTRGRSGGKTCILKMLTA
ncbi:MAG: pyruvate kinase [Kistimonas sp.]|nr:pyruvate kinase [Kistimonas sp.]